MTGISPTQASTVEDHDKNSLKPGNYIIKWMCKNHVGGKLENPLKKPRGGTFA